MVHAVVEAPPRQRRTTAPLLRYQRPRLLHRMRYLIFSSSSSIDFSSSSLHPVRGRQAAAAVAARVVREGRLWDLLRPSHGGGKSNRPPLWCGTWTDAERMGDDGAARQLFHTTRGRMLLLLQATRGSRRNEENLTTMAVNE